MKLYFAYNGDPSVGLQGSHATIELDDYLKEYYHEELNDFKDTVTKALILLWDAHEVEVWDDYTHRGTFIKA